MFGVLVVIFGPNHVALPEKFRRWVIRPTFRRLTRKKWKPTSASNDHFTSALYRDDGADHIMMTPVEDRNVIAWRLFDALCALS
jgi:hypothetical protein